MNQKIKTLQFIHLALCGGLIAASLFAGNAIENLKAFKLDPSNYAYFAIPIAAIILSNMAFQVQLKKIDKTISPEENLPHYQTASLVRWAILEGAAFVIIFMMPENIVFAIPLIIYLIFLRPTQEKVTVDLQKIQQTN